MEHLAIDLGGKKSQICLRSSEGQILTEAKVVNEEIQSWLEGSEPRRVIVETCTEAFAIADLAVSRGHDVRVVPSGLVRMLGVGARGKKTDLLDARALSEASCRIDLPSVHLPSAWSRRVKSMCGMRDVLVQSRTMMVNSVRAWSRTQLKAVRRATLKTLPLRMREQAASCGEKLPDFVERLLVSIEQLTEQIKAATKELSALAGENEVCRRLMTVPGVGAITALRFVAAIDEIGRFSHAHQLESYLGLTPGEDSSSERRRITSITKAGPSQVRWTLVQASWAALRCAPNDPMCRWAKQVMLRRGKRIAIVALARKLAGILYAIWRDGSAYDPARNGSAR
jgi:transposase